VNEPTTLAVQNDKFTGGIANFNDAQPSPVWETTMGALRRNVTPIKLNTAPGLTGGHDDPEQKCTLEVRLSLNVIQAP